MFCPRCSVENGIQQKYCRHCGLDLAAARISLQGGVGEALTAHKKGEVLLSSGAITLVIFIVGALANVFLSPGWNYPVLINLLLGLVIGVPLMAAGVARLRRARGILNPKDESEVLDQPSQTLPPNLQAPSTERLFLRPKDPGSVTEQTTLNLKSPAKR